MACFLDSPLVMGWTFFSLLFCLENVALWISSILLFGRARKASLILRIFEMDEVAWAYDRVEEFFFLPEVFLLWLFAFSNSSFERWGGIGESTFLTKLSLRTIPLLDGTLAVLNFEAILSLTEMSSDVINWSYPASKIAEIKFYIDSPKELSCLILLPLWPLKFLCLRK